ncbi:hypothetical protein EGI22_19610 [Lacihabitans sp. LS3-19]|uniref:hypothetical protein n=1 Tax=Lacihabitans sp. LS3-19 TaxID=2487335 RepID=UPI0020CF29BA|nr:hypothetical protein [Lacihabitans sp. LS3-19]MCP9770117.1 hypothetical protein [Lacihabitans sp. LS3-19]
MRRIILTLLVLFLGLSFSYSQEIRTFTNVNFKTNLSKSNNNFSISVGEMLQLKKRIPVRIITSFQFTGKVFKETIWPPDKKSGSTQLIVKDSFLNSSFNLPLGVEFFHKDFGLGIMQEVASFNLSKSVDSSKVVIPVDMELKPVVFNSIFSKNNNLNSTIYVVYTVSDSFSVKLGLNSGANNFNFYKDSKKINFARISEKSVFLSLRINIEK